MIIGIGVDIIEIERIRQAVSRERFVQKVFTAAEQQYCSSRGNSRFASYAARFAGKEAVMKAFGTGAAGGAWLDIEILNQPQGSPFVRLTGRFAELADRMQVSAIPVSLTHARDYAAAQAILWGGVATNEGEYSCGNAGN